MKLLNPLKLDKKEKIKSNRRRTVRKSDFLNKIFRRRKIRENKKNRDKEIKRRKNFLPSLMLTIIFWLVSFYIIFFIDPLESGALQLFILSIFLSFYFTFSLLFGNSRRALLTTFSVICFLVLRYFGIGNIINIILIAGIAITTEIYFIRK